MLETTSMRCCWARTRGATRPRGADTAALRAPETLARRRFADLGYGGTADVRREKREDLTPARSAVSGPAKRRRLRREAACHCGNAAVYRAGAAARRAAGAAVASAAARWRVAASVEETPICGDPGSLSDTRAGNPMGE